MEMAAKEAATNMSLVDKYAKEAQAEFQTIGMGDLAASGNYSCPRKYLQQRDQPLEVPMDCIRKLCDHIDQDFDDKITLDELAGYVKTKELPIEESVVDAMYADAIKGRGFVSEAQRLAPLNHDEIATAVRGRHAWDTKARQWYV